MSQITSIPSFTAGALRHTHIASKEVRERVLKMVQYNVFSFPAALVVADFLSDSGTAAMTSGQWSAIMQGDESYGRNDGYYYFLEALRDIFERGDNRLNTYREYLLDFNVDTYLERFLKYQEGGFVNGGSAQLTRPNTFIVPQGRCAESLLFHATAAGFDRGTAHPPAIISNGFFDTTSANAKAAGFSLHPFSQEGCMEARHVPEWRSENSFKGNMNTSAAEQFLSTQKQRGNVALIVLTVTNNTAAGQPVSMENIKEVSRLSQTYGVPLLLDACRFAENAMFIKLFEKNYSQTSINEIVREMFSYADGFTISLKKDGLANIGGVLCLRDGGMLTTKYPDMGVKIREEQITRYGNDSYGGMSGRDLMAATVGLYEGTNENYLMSRLDQVKRFAEKLSEADLPVILPPGGSAIFLDMDAFFQDCTRHYKDFPGVGFTLELLSTYGIRSFELGPFALEWDRSEHQDSRENATPNLVRFAVPRNALTDQHLDYTVSAIKELKERRHTIGGARITHGKNLSLRHFQSALEPIPVDSMT
ncbi:hypothetical protein FVER53590_14027 [Fusarium verticillioides]|nr:hypothetical protein FVER53590_14027 [Fusarium verticillioides]